MELYVDPSYPRFTRAELVAELSPRFRFTDGTFRNWQSKGLIAEPRREHRWAKGRAGSREALWTDHDRQMLIALLELRERHRNEGREISLGDLGNVVVWSWAYSDGVVELKQAKQALLTWVRPLLGGSLGTARSKKRFDAFCRQAIDRLAEPTVSTRARNCLAARMSRCFWVDDLEGLQELKTDLEGVIDPDGMGRRVGAPGASAGAQEEIERLIMIHTAAKAVAAGDSTLRDEDWRWAQQAMRHGWVEYQRDWRHLVANATTPDLFEAPTLDLSVSRCSVVLLTMLGSRILYRKRASVA